MEQIIAVAMTLCALSRQPIVIIDCNDYEQMLFVIHLRYYEISATSGQYAICQLYPIYPILRGAFSMGVLMVDLSPCR
jgi:hypothetical protein